MHRVTRLCRVNRSPAGAGSSSIGNTASQTRKGAHPRVGSMGSLSSISIKVALIKPLAKSHIRSRAKGSHDPWWEVSEQGPVCGPQAVD